jgi:hypothetical protein
MEGCTHGQYQYTSRNKINLKIKSTTLDKTVKTKATIQSWQHCLLDYNKSNHGGSQRDW